MSINTEYQHTNGFDIEAQQTPVSSNNCLREGAKKAASVSGKILVFGVGIHFLLNSLAFLSYMITSKCPVLDEMHLKVNPIGVVIPTEIVYILGVVCPGSPLVYACDYLCKL